MKFRTEIDIKEAKYPISIERSLLMLGSCFTENIGALFSKYLFNVVVNPFGVTYNPQSIHNGINQLIDKVSYTESDLGYYNELYYSFDHYTKFSDTDKGVVLKRINVEFLKAKEILSTAGHLILTFGSAYIYELKESGKIVNNCHKKPASEFYRRMLSLDEIISQYSELVKKLLSINNSLKILFTVSPVRHLKDGFVENQRSKSVLLLSINALESLFPDSCFYFPSYEILMDDLRDYRYYNNDLIHPNEAATDYIWAQLLKSSIDEKSKRIIHEIAPLLSALNHKPIHEGTDAYRKFKYDTVEKVRKLQNSFPFLNWDKIANNSFFNVV